ncbi:MAG: hypothetical protein U9R79_20565 [Armatimonadota bacterium]|nr:hypothetical protein [Armatimonadota bacterium]
MPQRFCRHCGVRIADEAARYCPECGRELSPRSPSAETPEGRQPSDREGEAPQPPEAAGPAGVAPGDAGPGEPREEPRVGPETPLEQAAEDVQRQEGGVPADDVRRCPHCGEAVYEVEQVCWNCRGRLLPSESEAEPTPRPGAPMTGQPTRPAPAQRPAAPPAPPEVMSTAWWAFGLGLASVLTCGALGLLGIVAIWLGVGASRRGAGPVAVAGIVFGVVGTLLLVGWALGLTLYLSRMAPPEYVLNQLAELVMTC